MCQPVKMKECICIYAWNPAMHHPRVLQPSGDPRAVRDHVAARGRGGAARVAADVCAQPRRDRDAAQCRHRRGGRLLPLHDHALRALHAVLAAADGDISALFGARSGVLGPSGGAGRGVGRADAAQLRAEPRAVRAHTPATPHPRRRSALCCRVLQAEAQVVARIRVVLSAGGDHSRRQRLRQRTAPARARPHGAAAAHQLTNTKHEERRSTTECSAAECSAARRSTAQHNTAGRNTA